jgi:hypothetical protein
VPAFSAFLATERVIVTHQMQLVIITMMQVMMTRTRAQTITGAVSVGRPGSTGETPMWGSLLIHFPPLHSWRMPLFSHLTPEPEPAKISCLCSDETGKESHDTSFGRCDRDGFEWILHEEGREEMSRAAQWYRKNWQTHEVLPEVGGVYEHYQDYGTLVWVGLHSPAIAWQGYCDGSSTTCKVCDDSSVGSGSAMPSSLCLVLLFIRSCSTVSLAEAGGMASESEK